MDAHIKLALEMDDGSTCIYMFATETRGPTLPVGAVWKDQTQGRWTREPTDANIWAEFRKAFPGRNQLGIKRPAPLAFHRITDADVPAQRDYRNSWEIVGGKVKENLAKARELHRDKLRNQRTADLAMLDVEWSRAMAKKDTKTANAIEAQRQELRDITDDPRIDAAQSVDDLRLVTL